MLTILLVLGNLSGMHRSNATVSRKAHHSKVEGHKASHQRTTLEQSESKLNAFTPADDISLGGGSYTPLMRACNLGDLERVKMLLSKNVNINAKNELGITALMLAAQENGLKYGKSHATPETYGQVVTLLLLHGADAKVTDTKTNSVLTYAAWGGNVQVAELLITKGASIDTTSSFGTTMLHAAVTSRNIDMVKLFLDKGANVNAINSQGRSPLSSATMWIFSLEIFRSLIERGANIKIRDADGKTFLMEVCSSIGSTDSARLVQEKKARLLIEKGIDIDLQSDSSLATREVNKQLEGFGVVRGMATSGQTALMFAARGDDPEMVKLLLAHGANVDLSDEKGQTALLHACRAEKLDNAKLLLNSKADPNSVDATGVTALMIATQADNLELVEAFLAKKADTKFRDDDGKTAADYLVPDGKVAKVIGNQLAPDTPEKSNNDTTNP